LRRKKKTLHDTPEDLQPSQKVEVANHVFYLDTALLKDICFPHLEKAMAGNCKNLKLKKMLVPF
jgi:hypothetical protein